MTLTHVRFRIAAPVITQNPGVSFDCWTCFRFKRIMPRGNQDFTEAEIEKDNKILHVRFADIELYPRIVTTTHDFGEFLCSTTFDVDFSEPQPLGFVPVINPRCKTRTKLPSGIVLPIATHLDVLAATAV